jgi:hypothetical protein
MCVVFSLLLASVCLCSLSATRRRLAKGGSVLQRDLLMRLFHKHFIQQTQMHAEKGYTVTLNCRDLHCRYPPPPFIPLLHRTVGFHLPLL